MRQKFFFRRALQYFVMMMIPMVLLFSTFYVLSTHSEENRLLEKGDQTIQSVAVNCETVISGVSEQNNLLTTATRMSLALRHMLNENYVSYADSVNVNALRTSLDSIANAVPVLDSILIWLDGAPRVFSSTGDRITLLKNAQSVPWLETYQQMDPDTSYLIIPNQTTLGTSCITVIRRLLLQEGCTVVNINSARWKRDLKPMLHREQEHVYLVNDQGQILLHVSNEAADPMLTDDDMAEVMASEQGRWLNLSAGKYLPSHSSVDGLNIVVLVSRQALAEAQGSLLSIFLLIFLLDMLVVVLLAYFTTRRICNQMLLMIDTFDRAMNGEPIERPIQTVRDEYDVIMNNILYMYLKESAMKAQLQEEQFRKMHAEFMALQLQINPHFLYNTLQTLDICIRTDNMDRFDLSDVIHDLSDILKYALSDPQQHVTLAEELKYLRNYAAVQKFRFNNRFIIYYEIEEELLQCSVFRMMLQPLVENSMIHGLNGLSERGYIWVTATRRGDRLRLSVRDSGMGMTEAERVSLLQRVYDAKGRSIGLQNLNSRLVLRYGEDSRLQIESAPGQGTNVYFDIPFQVETKEKVSFNDMKANDDTFLPENSVSNEEIE